MEQNPNFDVLTCSQSSDLGQEQLNEIEQKAQAKSTKKATEWRLKKFDKWCGMSDNSPPGQLAPDNSPPIFRRLAPDLQTTRPQYENSCVTLGEYIFMLIK